MLNNPAIDIAIGLVFIYAVYSLLTTTLTEFFGSVLNQRGKILRSGLHRMLDTENTLQPGKKGRSGKSDSDDNTDPPDPKNDNSTVNGLHVTEDFKQEETGTNAEKPSFVSENLSTVLLERYEIKYLKSRSLIRIKGFPTYINPRTFAKALLHSIGYVYGKNWDNLENLRKNLNPENAIHAYILDLMSEAGNNVERFKSLTEDWFNEMMEQVSSWYKQRMLLITFLCGLFLAYTMNVNTIEIVNRLGEDKKARIALVEAASGYVESLAASDSLSDSTEKSIEELSAEIKQLLKESNEKASILNLAYPWQNQNAGIKENNPNERTTEEGLHSREIIRQQTILQDPGSPAKGREERPVSWWSYIFGCFVTGLALSLGAPFWFDLLNKLLRLKVAGLAEKNSKKSMLNIFRGNILWFMHAGNLGEILGKSPAPIVIPVFILVPFTVAFDILPVNFLHVYFKAGVQNAF